MTENYFFSPSLEGQVQLCIATAQNKQPNKWLKEFGHLNFAKKAVAANEAETFIDICNTPENSGNNVYNAIKDVHEHFSEDKVKESSSIVVKNIEEIVDALETEFISSVDFMIEKCLGNHALLVLLAKRLSSPTVQKLCIHIFDKKDFKDDFLSIFFEYFLPAYIKREYNSNTLDLLIKGNKIHPIHFKMLLQRLVKDVDMPTKVLQDYILVLNESERMILLMNLTEIDFSVEEFVNNLFSIYTAYKDCPKTEQVQNYVYAILSQYCKSCVLDRNYGKLFFAFLQAQKYVKSNVDYESLDNILGIHRSLFKRPCVTIIKELKGDNKSSSDEESN